MNILSAEDIGISLKLIPDLTAKQNMLFPVFIDSRQLLLADEPAGNLDEKNGKKIYSLKCIIVACPQDFRRR